MAVLQGSAYPAELVSGADLSGSTVVCTATSPLGVVSSPAVAVSGSTATAVIPATTVGVWLVVWTVTGAVSGVTQDQFTVKVAVPDLISLPDLKEELNWGATDTSKDPKFRRWITAANDVIENITGPVRPMPRTDVFDGGTPFVVLRVERAASITAVSEVWGGVTRVLVAQPFGLPVTADGYVWDQNANVLSRFDSGGNPWTFQAGPAGVQVTYVAGMATIPEDIQLAAAELIRHWFRKNDKPVRGASYGAGQGDDTVMVGNYMVPNSVMELLGPWRRAPQVA